MPPVKVTAEGLPEDLACGEKGIISGIVEVGGGMCPVTVYAKDSAGAEVRRDFFLTVLMKGEDEH